MILTRSADIIVVGAGASGLMIARILSEAGKNVIVLEARDRTGGRIHTIGEPAFLMPLETGAEFIHGDLPVTFRLLKEAGIHYRNTGGDSWTAAAGEFMQDDYMNNDDLLTDKLNGLKEDITVAAFLETYFSSEEHNGLRETITGFVEGYDAADINRASTFALRKEWQDINEGSQYRVDGGYTHMIRFLETESRKNGCLILLSSVVKEILWQQGIVNVIAADRERYTAKKIVITVPLGVLNADYLCRAAISFTPSLTGKEKLFQSLGYGGVIKVLLLFNHAFWKDIITPGKKSLKDMGWIFSGESIPTWWSQAPEDSALLTGWLAGPKAQALKDTDDQAILYKALESLCKIFTLGRFELTEMLAYSAVVNWISDPFSLGAYSYATPGTREAVRQLSIPVDNTIFFAGEALYDGDETGTVEAALGNGLKVAGLVLDNY